MPQHCKAAAVGCRCDGVESRRRLEQELLRERPGSGRGASLGRFFAGGRGAATSAIDHFGLLWSFGNAGHGPTAAHLSKLIDFGRSRDGEEDQRTPESWMIDPPAGFGSAHVVFDAARQAHTFGARPAPPPPCLRRVDRKAQKLEGGPLIDPRVHAPTPTGGRSAHSTSTRSRQTMATGSGALDTEKRCVLRGCTGGHASRASND